MFVLENSFCLNNPEGKIFRASLLGRMALSLKPVIPNEAAGKGMQLLVGISNKCARLLRNGSCRLRSISGRDLQVANHPGPWDHFM